MLNDAEHTGATSHTLSLAGVIDIFVSRRIAGWALQRSEPSPAELLFEVDGEIRATLRCDKERPDLHAKLAAPLHCGFAFDPRPFLQTGNNECRLLFNDEFRRQLGRTTTITVAPPGSATPRMLKPELVWAGRADPSFLLANTDSASPSAAQVLGQFNSGTNFALNILRKNAVNHTNISMNKLLFKHYPPEVLQLIADFVGGVRQLLVVMIRNPYEWVRSMILSPYGCQFADINSAFKVNLTTLNFSEITYEDHVAKYLDGLEWRRHFEAESIVAYWSRCCRAWMQVGASLQNVVFLRYEDLVLHPCEAVLLIQNAIAQPSSKDLVVPVSTAKPGHTHSRDYWGAKGKLINTAAGQEFSSSELSLMRRHLDTDVCDFFGYQVL